MNDRLPPLNALKVFEAAARHLSVKLAAEELCVTPGAVSQMLKTLEAHLGVKLFERVPRGIYLTDAGRDYLPSIRNAFRQIAEASRRVARRRYADGERHAVLCVGLAGAAHGVVSGRASRDRSADRHQQHAGRFL